VPSASRIRYDEETIEVRLPKRLAIVTGVNHEGDFVCHVEAETECVETGTVKKFGGTTVAGTPFTREEMAERLAKWFHHEMLEQFGCEPEHSDPDVE
jgi:hypothetical protein